MAFLRKSHIRVYLAQKARESIEQIPHDFTQKEGRLGPRGVDLAV